LNSKIGEEKSINFLSDLISQGGNSNFESLAIQGLLDYKLSKLMPLAMTKLGMYFMYLLLMNLFDFTITILIFFVYQTIWKIIQLHRNRNHLALYFFTPWNILDVIRILTMVTYLISVCE
jgi:hypothetical protein